MSKANVFIGLIGRGPVWGKTGNGELAEYPRSKEGKQNSKLVSRCQGRDRRTSGKREATVGRRKKKAIKIGRERNNEWHITCGGITGEKRGLQKNTNIPPPLEEGSGLEKG